MKTRLIRMLSTLLAALMLALALVSFAACGKEPSVTVYFEYGDEKIDYTVKLSDYAEGATLYDALKQDKKLAAKMDETTTPFLTAIFGYEPDAEAGFYIAIYTTLADKAWGDDTMEKDGKTFYTSGYGVAELPLIEGASYLFRIESWM